MKAFSKSLTALAVATATLASLPAHAVVVTFGGQVATDGSGLTSNFVPANNVLNLANGYLIETFDVATAMAGLTAGTTAANPESGISIQQNQGCSINSYNSVDISTTGGGFSVRKGSVGGVAAAPANDTTCFGFGPQQGGTLPATVKIDYTSFLTGLIGSGSVPAGTAISYLGLYYGSIDT